MGSVLITSLPRTAERVKARVRGLLDILWHHRPFRLVRPTDRGPENGSDAAHWVDGVRVGGVARAALLMPPGSALTFTVEVPPNAALRAALAVLPVGMPDGGVTFSLTVAAEGRRHLRREWVAGVDTAGAWRAVAVDLGPFDGRVVEVTFAVAAAPGGRAAGALAAWGEPELVHRRALGAFLRDQVLILRTFGLRGALEQYRARIATTGEAASVYAVWRKRTRHDAVDMGRLRAASARFRDRPTISLLLPLVGADLGRLRACVESVRRQAYPHWELCLAPGSPTDPEVLRALAALGGGTGADPRIIVARPTEGRRLADLSNGALAMASGELVGLLDADDALAADALYEVAKALNDRPDADLIYSDEDRLEPDGSRDEPYFKPDWSPEHLRSTMYIGRLAVYRRSAVDAVGGFRPAFEDAQDYDLALRVVERTDRVLHIPRVLYHRRRVAEPGAAAESRADAAAVRALADHLARLGVDARVEPRPGNGLWRVRYQIVGEPLVSIIIPTAGRILETPDGPRDVVLHCARSVLERTTYARYELLVVDDGHLSPAAQAYLALVPHRRISYAYSGPFSFAAKVNFCARHARGEHLVLLNDDTEVLTDEWLSAMLELSQQPAVGAVGAKLYYPDGSLQHVGVILGIGGGAGHVFAGFPSDHGGYFSSAQIIRNYSAVTAACLMTRREVFDEVGGFDETFATDFNDIDYCLRVGCDGYRVVFTPFAELRHYEGASYGRRSGLVTRREIAAFRARWGRVIEADPYYNPNLTRFTGDYSLKV